MQFCVETISSVKMVDQSVNIQFLSYESANEMKRKMTLAYITCYKYYMHYIHPLEQYIQILLYNYQNWNYLFISFNVECCCIYLVRHQ